MDLEEVSFLEDVQFPSNGYMLSSLPSSLSDIPAKKNNRLIVRETNCRDKLVVDEQK